MLHADESPFEMARRKIEHLTRSLQLIQLERADIESRVQDNLRQLQAWKTIYQSEMPAEFTEDEETRHSNLHSRQ
jgi:hypothetical protein